MLTASIVKKTQLEGENRLDSEYYQPHYLEVRENIDRIGYKTIRDLRTDFGSGKNLSQSFSGTPFIRTQNVRPILIDDTGLSFTDTECYPMLDYGDLLFVRVGEGVGNSSVVCKSYINSAFSDNVIRIKVRDVNPFYISTLLNSKIGDILMEQIKKGSARSLISKENTDLIRIPLIAKKDQEYFEIIVNESENYSNKSKKFLLEAENLLLGEMGLKDFRIKNDLFLTTKLSNVKSVHRIDADYFQLKYQKLFESIKNAKKLGELVTIKRGFEPGSDSYQSEGKKFIRVSNIFKEGLSENDQKYISSDLFNKLKNDFQPKVGEILLTKDATPGIAYVLKEETEGIISGGILRLKPKGKIEPEYLALCINSIVGRMQAERDAGGSIINHWRPDQIKELLIPVLPLRSQKSIANLVRSSHEFRKKSKDLLEEAKRKVEELVEGQGN